MTSRRTDLLASGKTLLALSGLIVAINAGIAVHPPAFRSLDTRFLYSAGDAYGLLDSLGPGGRSEYLVRELVDLLFLATYTLLLIGLLRRTFHATTARIPDWAALLSLAPGALDLAETTGILVLISLYPDRSWLLARAVSIATPLKWLSFIPWAAVYLVRLARGKKESHA